MLSSSARVSALAFLAIVAPAAIVAALGYVSIRQWEASSELLYREQARDMATMAAEKVEMTLRRAEDAFLDRLRRADDAWLDERVGYGDTVEQVLREDGPHHYREHTLDIRSWWAGGEPDEGDVDDLDELENPATEHELDVDRLPGDREPADNERL